jgi:hypothetical protein
MVISDVGLVDSGGSCWTGEMRAHAAFRAVALQCQRTCSVMAVGERSVRITQREPARVAGLTRKCSPSLPVIG